MEQRRMLLNGVTALEKERNVDQSRSIKNFSSTKLSRSRVHGQKSESEVTKKRKQTVRFFSVF